jgi:hypothetical protein
MNNMWCLQHFKAFVNNMWCLQHFKAFVNNMWCLQHFKAFVNNMWCLQHFKTDKSTQNIVPTCMFISDLQQVGSFSLDPPVSSTNKTDCHDITEILLKVALNTIKP